MKHLVRFERVSVADQYNIMFVDDEPEIMSVMEFYAGKLGFGAITCESVAQAMIELEKHHASLILVISDLKMPDVDGMEFRKRLLDINNYKDIPFAVVSGFITREMAIDAVRLKISGFLEKPAKQEDIGSLIKSHCADRIDLLDEKKMLKTTFLEESSAIIEELEPLILSLENNPQDQNTLNTIFRLVHTIKGASGVLEQKDIPTYLHKFEDLLAKIKSNKIAVTPQVISILLSGFDVMQRMIADLHNDNLIEYNLKKMTEIFDLERSQEESRFDERGDNNEQAASSKVSESRITVTAELLDHLLEKSGEMTVMRNMVNKLIAHIDKELPANANIALLTNLLSEMHKINSGIQSSISDLRKVPLSRIFRTIPRTVRDTTRSLNKKATLQVNGDTLRVDTSIAQTLSESMVHIIRNAIDHGMEMPEERTAVGKPESGTIELKAYQEADTIIIKISDNGQGIDPKFIAAKAVEKGLITIDRVSQLSDQNIFSFIFHSGFSTAEQITSISGRGVGMDMVRSSVERSGGSILIDSKLGEGTTFTINLPIPKSVMIINSLLVQAGGEEIAIPQDDISRLIHIDGDQGGKGIFIREVSFSPILEVDGELIPIVDLKKSLGLAQRVDQDKSQEHVNLIVVNIHGRRYALSVEKIMDAEEIVVKEVSYLRSCRSFKGATFSGDGRVVLILDIEGLFEIALGKSASEQQYPIGDHFENYNKKTTEISESIIVFDLSEPNPYAIRVSNIFRLEIFSSKQVQWIGRRSCVNYRGKVLPLVNINQIINLNKERYFENNEFNVVIVDIDKQLVGLMVKSIVDICKSPEHIDKDMTASQFFNGISDVNGQLTTFLDIDKILYTDGLLDTPKELPISENIIPISVEDLIGDDAPVEVNASMGFF